MAKYVCSKCGSEVDSKCIHQRNSFPLNILDALLSYSLKFNTEIERNPGRKTRVKLHVAWIELLDEDEGMFMPDWPDRMNLPVEERDLAAYMAWNLAEQFVEMAKDNANTDENPFPSIEQYFCSHDYKIQHGTCLFGCCVAEEKPMAELTPILPDIITIRAYTCLKRAGIRYWERVADYSDDELLEIRNLGHKSLEEIREAQYIKLERGKRS